MTNAATIIKLAKGEVGYHEGRSGTYWNNEQKYSPAVPGLEWSQNQAWCATFISWLAMKAGIADLYPRSASTDFGANWFRERKRFSDYPAVGAQGFLGVNGDMYHTFLVVRYDADYVYTVEGNTNNNGSSQGDGVYELRRPRSSTSIVGYGYPDFAEGIDSADPNYRKPDTTQEDDMPYTPKELAKIVGDAVAAKVAPLEKKIDDIAKDVDKQKTRTLNGRDAQKRELKKLGVIDDKLDAAVDELERVRSEA